MGRGIIVVTGAGGSPPKLVITDFDASQRSFYVPGNEMECFSPFPLKVGFLVDGTVDPNNNKIFNVMKVIDDTPTVISGSQGGNITIGADKVYFVESSGALTGSVNVNGGVLMVNGGKATGNISIDSNSTIVATNGATIGGGSFEVTGSGTNAVIAFGDSTINGKFDTEGITFVNLRGNNFNGNVTSSKDQYVHIKDNFVNNNKNLTVSDVVVECKISNNTVSGTTTLDPKCQP
ncbi:MAG: hypothetical protein K0Q95_1158 [Bacteroidota bacterium]|jgi:hypothetical protein|nr:hypothetical protein [Bacteroidota bacterium]